MTTLRKSEPGRADSGAGLLAPAAGDRTASPGGSGPDASWPAFLREFESTLAVHPQYLLHGNIREVFSLPGLPGLPPVPLPELLWQALRINGYSCLIRYDAVDGIGVLPDTPAARAAAEKLLGQGTVGREVSLDKLRPLLARACGARPADAGARPADAGARVGFVVEYAARLTRGPGQLDQRERDFFLFCHKLAHVAEASYGGPAGRSRALYNPLIWLVEGERDLPSWYAAGDDRIRSIAVPLPDLPERQRVATAIAANFGLRPAEPAAGPAVPGGEVAEQPIPREITAFALAADGLSTRSMWEVMRLAFDRGIPFGDIGDAVRMFKLGVADNPWASAHLFDRIRRGETEVAGRVKGQQLAVGKTFDILKRAALGLSGAQAASSGTRPRGVMFFAGPTGVGKTELAKQIARTLFGRTDAYLRFDMSEFAAEHAADRLTGAPPGYVGFESGGELTSAIRQDPFRVVLFDEIEKAHRGVLDKFLQILEDGRLTDGQGTTTYFSECVLIFTSNLGVMRTDPQTGEKVPVVEPGTAYAELESRIGGAIREHFTAEIGRPELLNRFGDNIVVFDFIGAGVAAEIFDLQVGYIRDRLMAEHRVRLDLAPAAVDRLRRQCCADLRHGGRGIGNALESKLVNPLARGLFDLVGGLPAVVRVDGLTEIEGRPGLVLSVGEAR